MKENHENPIVILGNHGTLENQRIPLRITKVMKILEFNARIMKFIKIIKLKQKKIKS